MRPGRYDLVLPQRATYRERFRLPIDCTDREVVAQIWSMRGRERLTKLADLTVTWVDRAVVIDGETKAVFDLSASAEITAAVAQPAQWDLLVVDGDTLHNGDQNYWLHGAVVLDPGLSEVA